jgi:hypothetical protein
MLPAMTIRRLLIALAAGLLGPVPGAVAAPAQIIFLRHAEKPSFGPELDARGRERATALATLFTKDPRVLGHGPAAGIFAMRQAKPGTSVRPIQTIEPTGRALGLPLDTRFTRDEISAVVRAILTSPACDGKTVIVCWEHDAIPEMLQALGWTRGPKNWPDKSYDRLWLLDLENGKPVRFRDLPQKLLPGDKAK